LINLVRLWLEKPPVKSRGLPLLVPYENKSVIRVQFLARQKLRFNVHVYHAFHHVLTIKTPRQPSTFSQKPLYLAAFFPALPRSEKTTATYLKTTLQERSKCLIRYSALGG
jgi:hypothetical protein